MTKIAQITDRSSAAAWSPISGHEDTIAIGSKDGGGVGFDDTGGELELYDMNLTIRAAPLLLAKVKTQSRFASLGWSSCGPHMNARYPLGFVAGGMENGNVHVWDPQAVMNSQDQQIVVSHNAHGPGAIKALEFNKLVPSKLATGGSDGKVLIIDLDQPDPKPFPPCANNTHQRAPITSLAWNTKVSHILASAAADGTLTVWDTNSRKAWCELRAETSGQPISSIAWNPEEGLQLLTASADDRNPVIKVWDLRTSTSMPLAMLSGHGQGILSIAWCPHDEHLLLSCGKDNRTILWDLYTSQPIGDVPNDVDESLQQAGGNDHSMFGLASSQQRRYDVQWSPIKRGIICTASLDRKVQVHSILGLSSSSGRPPKWMRPTSSVSCGFGGVFVYCGSKDRAVRFITVVEEPELEKVSREFESTMDPSNVISFCQSRAATAKLTSEKLLWQFMSVIFDTNNRHMLLDTLGFDPVTISAKAATHRYSEDAATITSNGIGSMSVEDKSLVGMSPVTHEVVKQALMVGNFDAAVECCYNTGNLADALILASCGGEELWTKTKDRYFQSQSPKRPFLSVVSSIIQQDFGSFVQSSDPAKWKETLAILSTYSSSIEFPQLCVDLGDLLEDAGDKASASLCYMCSLNLDNAVKYWRNQYNMQTSSTHGVVPDLLSLHDYVVKASVYLQAVGSSAELSVEDAKLFTKYAQKLADQGLLVFAAKYCKGDTSDSKILRDRLYRSRNSQRCLAAMGGRPPEFPFTISDVKQSSAPTISVQKSSQRSHGNISRAANGYAQEYQSYLPQQAPQPSQVTESNVLPTGWMELQDPSSGRVYYANQTTGETTWDRPQATPVPVPSLTPIDTMSQAQTQCMSNSRNMKLASQYGDGFVSSHSRPELASQYGNVGTSNPYHNSARPATAKASNLSAGKAPVSGNIQTIPELSDEYQPITETMLSLIGALKGGQLSASDKRQLSEAEKGVAIFVKRLALGEIPEVITQTMLSMTTALSSYDWTSAGSIQTALVAQEWRSHKEWLKGIKALVQLAIKLYSR